MGWKVDPEVKSDVNIEFCFLATTAYIPRPSDPNYPNMFCTDPTTHFSFPAPQIHHLTTIASDPSIANGDHQSSDNSSGIQT